MSDRVWHEGPPRFPGWWNASIKRDEECWRWWSGEHWGESVYADFSQGRASISAAKKSPWKDIEWTDYWPENARVPRLDHTGGHWTFNTDDKPPPYTGVIDVAFRHGHIAKAVPQFGWLGFDWKRDGLPADILAWRPAA